MKSCDFDDKELDLINFAIHALQKDLRFELKSACINYDLQSAQHCLDGLSLIEFILPKIKI